MAQPTAPRVDPELLRQVFGYWFGPDENVPAFPAGRPTGAVLPALGQEVGTASDLLCLDLVPVQNYWLVLSELGRYTYRHTSGLLFGEEWTFVPIAESVGAWPVVYRVSFAESIPPAQIAARYGVEAAGRARPDAPTVQLRLERR